MGRRTRARRAAQPPPEAPSPPARGPARLTDERPKPPWHPVPLVELSVFVGLVLIVVGFLTGVGSDGGRLALLCGLVLASLGGLDTVLREHFAGFRSHSAILAGACTGSRSSSASATTWPTASRRCGGRPPGRPSARRSGGS